jgi:hypothetical protein
MAKPAFRVRASYATARRSWSIDVRLGLVLATWLLLHTCV